MTIGGQPPTRKKPDLTASRLMQRMDSSSINFSKAGAVGLVRLPHRWTGIPTTPGDSGRRAELGATVFCHRSEGRTAAI